MFKQFIDKATGVQPYMISSLIMFFLFFLLVALLLIRMKRKHVDYMSELPLNDE